MFVVVLVLVVVSGFVELVVVLVITVVLSVIGELVVVGLVVVGLVVVGVPIFKSTSYIQHIKRIFFPVFNFFLFFFYRDKERLLHNSNLLVQKKKFLDISMEMNKYIGGVISDNSCVVS